MIVKLASMDDLIKGIKIRANHVLIVFDWRRAGSWCGLAGPVFFIALWSAAVASTPGYRVGEQWVSDLGVGEGAIYFNSGVIVAGILAIPFAVSLGAVLRPQILGIIGSCVMVMAGAALMGIGIFTEDVGEIHWIVSVAFFSLITITLFLFIWPFHKSNAMRPWSAPFTAIIFSIGMIIAAATGFGPLTETVVVFLIAIWSLVIAWKLRYHLCIVLRRPKVGTSDDPSG